MESKSMTPVPGMTMLAVAKYCSGFRDTFQRAHYRRISAKRASNGSVYIEASVIGLFALLLIIFIHH